MKFPWTVQGNSRDGAGEGEGAAEQLDVSMAGDFQDQVVIDYLLRRAYREEWLYMPAVNLYPDRNWAAID